MNKPTSATPRIRGRRKPAGEPAGPVGQPAVEFAVEPPVQPSVEPAVESPVETAVDAAVAPADPVVHLEHGLQIKDVEEAHRRLKAAFDGGARVVVDVAKLGVVDTAGVQLLLALRGQAAARGIALDIRGESAALTQALAVLGLRGAWPAPDPAVPR
jgi:anti-anti-sigma regulatory factor